MMGVGVWQNYIRRVKGNELARIVKLADLAHNSDLTRLSAPTEKDRKRCELYIREIEFLKSETQ